MSSEMPGVLDTGPARSDATPKPGVSAWIETALTVLFAAATVLFMSFIAVVTGLA